MKIYSGWAFSKDEKVKAKENMEAYEKIKDKAKLELIGRGYHCKRYLVIENPEGLSKKELALIADEGNLCFGYRVENDYIIIHTD